MFLWLLSLAIVCGEYWTGHSLFTPSLGFALSWLSFRSMKRAHLSAFVWFFSFSLIQLSWLPFHAVAAPSLFFAYIALSAFFALQYTFFIYFLLRSSFSLTSILALSGFWVLLEWIRLIPFSGFPWNPVGLSLATNPLSAQMASIAGIYGLSFWIVVTNGVALQMMIKKTKKAVLLWLVLALFPFLFGSISFLYNAKKPTQGTLHCLLVDTFYTPQKKGYVAIEHASSIPPLQQWEEVFQQLQCHRGEKIDLLCFPEGFAVYPLDHCFYSFKTISPLFSRFSLPLSSFNIEPGWVQIRDQQPYFSDGYIAKACAVWMKSDVIIGGEVDRRNVACFIPRDDQPITSYAKRKLVPLGEYIPCNFLRSLARKYGVEDSFIPGTHPVLFPSSFPSSSAICSEEAYGDLVRRGRKGGAQLLTHLTNDGWWLFSSPCKRSHLRHAQVRAIENGCPVLRCCNQGITTVINHQGELLTPFTPPDASQYTRILKQTVPIKTISTPYTQYGDAIILIISFLSLLLPLGKRKMH